MNAQCIMSGIEAQLLQRSRNRLAWLHLYGAGVPMHARRTLQLIGQKGREKSRSWPHQSLRFRGGVKIRPGGLKVDGWLTGEKGRKPSAFQCLQGHVHSE